MCPKVNVVRDGWLPPLLPITAQLQAALLAKVAVVVHCDAVALGFTNSSCQLQCRLGWCPVTTIVSLLREPYPCDIGVLCVLLYSVCFASFFVRCVFPPAKRPKHSRHGVTAPVQQLDVCEWHIHIWSTSFW